MENENKVLTVWKFPLSPQYKNTMLVPKGAKPLSVQNQHGSPMLWMLVDQAEPLEKRDFIIYGTGHDINAGDIGNFIGTFQQEGGMLIFHVFEARK